VPEHVRKVLELSQLTKLFDPHESEENAVAAFYHRGAKAETPVSTGRSVLCLDGNADVLAYLRENSSTAPGTTSIPAAAWATL
jgi:hypothetical protein